MLVWGGLNNGVMTTPCPPGAATEHEVAVPSGRTSPARANEPLPPQDLPDTAKVRELAVRADVDPRTIVKELKGQRTRGMAGRRAREVLVEAGLLGRGSKRLGRAPFGPVNRNE